MKYIACFLPFMLSKIYDWFLAFIAIYFGCELYFIMCNRERGIGSYGTKTVMPYNFGRAEPH